MTPFIILGIIIVWSFWHLDQSLANWKKEQDKKLDDLRITLDDLVTDFQDKFN